jgi:hypothetical protein
MPLQDEYKVGSRVFGGRSMPSFSLLDEHRSFYQPALSSVSSSGYWISGQHTQIAFLYVWKQKTSQCAGFSRETL